MEHNSDDLSRYGVEPSTGELKPWVPLLNMMRILSSQLPAQDGIEARFAKALQAATRAAMGYIETAESFGKLLDTVPAHDLVLAEIALNAARPWMMADFARLHLAWDRADIVALRSVQETGPLYAIASMRQALFLSRNENWAQTIAARGVPEVPHLLVVGALHLVGPDSLLHRLSERGLLVKPLIE